MALHKLDKVKSDLFRKQGPVALFKDWLFFNYNIKVNSLDTCEMFIEATTKNPIKYDYNITESDIYLHALDEGVKCSRALITNIIQSPNHVTFFNPIKEYFEALEGQYKGDSQMTVILKALHYPNQTLAKDYEYIIRKWLVAFAACVLGKSPNDVALGFVSEKAGIGKTTIFEEIIPFELRRYYYNYFRTSKPEINTQIFTNKILICFDELAAITRANENSFKQLLSSTLIFIKGQGERRVLPVERISNVCFTSNKTQSQGGFIKSRDPGILRRLASVELEHIDDYREKLDRQQLWAECVMLLKGGFDYQWNYDDYKLLTRLNMPYIETTTAMRLCQMYFPIPSDQDEVTFMSARDIVIMLRNRGYIKKTDVNIDEVSIGQAMNALGHRKVSKRIENQNPRYGYMVKAI